MGKGQKILINGAGGSIGTHGVQIAQHLGAEMTGSKKVILTSAPRKPEDLILLRELAEVGVLKSLIDRHYPLAQTAGAHRYVESGREIGHVVIIAPASPIE